MSQTIVYKTLRRGQRQGANPGGGLVGARWSDGSAGGGYVKPDPNYKPLRTSDGQPDIQGIWTVGTGLEGRSVEATAGDEGTANARLATLVQKSDNGWIVDPSGGRVPYQPWARAKVKYISDHFIAPGATCVPTGIPKMVVYVDFQIVQGPGEVLFVSEHLQNFRHVPLDGRPHLGGKLKLWMGDSRGRWDGSTLVIDVTNQNDKTWIGPGGIFHSDQLHVTERFTPIDPDTVQYEATIDDPVVYERTWKIAFPLTRTPDSGHLRKGLDTYEMLEENCAEGNHSIDALTALGWKLFTGMVDVTESASR